MAARNRFQFYVGAENSNRELLARVKKILRTVFHIDSKVRRKRKSGSLKVIRGLAFSMRRTSFSLLIEKINDVKKFEEQIDFSIARKNRKLRDALTIFEKYGRKGGSGEWAKFYFKKGGEWVRR